VKERDTLCIAELRLAVLDHLARSAAQRIAAQLRPPRVAPSMPPRPPPRQARAAAAAEQPRRTPPKPGGRQLQPLVGQHARDYSSLCLRS
jgi:hypothetical protein